MSSRTVLALTPSIGGYYFGELLTGLRRELAAAGVRLLLVQTRKAGIRDDGCECSDFDIPVAWSEVDGVVSVTTAAKGPYLQRVRAAGKPVVLVSSRLPDFTAPVAVPDNREGTRAAVDHLIAHGHARIGFVGNLGQPDIRDRYSAYLRALESAGLVADPALLFPAPDNDWTGGEEAARALLDHPERPTALAVATDRNAIGLIRVLADAGIAVPHDIAVIGFDNVEAAAFSTPTLSSVDQRFDEVGAHAARLLLRRLAGEPVSVQEHVLPASALTLRASCGCPTDVLGRRVGRAEAPRPGGPGRPRDVMAAGMRRVLRTGHRSLDEPMHEAVREVVEHIERLACAAESPSAEAVLHLSAAVGGLTTRPDALRRVVGTVADFLRQAEVGPGAGPLMTAMWRLHARAFLQQSDGTQLRLEEQYRVNAGIADGLADPRELRWLAGTQVRAAVFATWTGDPAAGEMRIAGVHDPHGLLPDLLHQRTEPEFFPPAELIDAAGAPGGGVGIVVPVVSAEHQWGLLAVIGDIDTSSTLETYHHWATQLSATLQERQLQEAVRASEERHALAARATNDGLWELDSRTGELYMSQRCLELVPLDDCPSRERGDRWMQLIHPDDLDEMRSAMLAITANPDETVNCEYRLRRPDGSYRWVLSRALSVRSPDGGVHRLVGSLSDIDERRSLEEQLRASALHDAVTGLPNRRLFLSRLEHAVQLRRRSGTPFAVIFLDLDRFKAINDSLGHQVGDQLLAAVGDRLEHELREVDVAARFGGDEFAVLLHDADQDSVLTVARRIQQALGEVIHVEGHDFVVGASLGVATSDVDYSCGEDVLRDADTAMYHAKATERGSIAFFDATMHARVLGQLRLSGEIRRALDEQQFEVHYQPIVDLHSGRADTFEALVRWRHPQRGLVPPNEFLPVMAENGLIVRLGRWIVDEVCRALAAWGPAVANVAVNLSDREFWHDGLLEHVLDCLDRHGVTADRLTLEITEGVVMHRPDAAMRKMTAMHDAGLQLHIDDFGTGYSSLEILHRFPVDALKIDRSFLAGLGQGNHSEELVRAIVAMGAALGLAVVAEGVESDQQVNFLREVGCRTAQGFLFSAAVRAEDVGQVAGQLLWSDGKVRPLRGQRVPA